jgi:hypothetical protein
VGFPSIEANIWEEKHLGINSGLFTRLSAFNASIFLAMSVVQKRLS